MGSSFNNKNNNLLTDMEVYMSKKNNRIFLGKPGGKKNYGWGAQLPYAGKMALKVHFGHRYATYGMHKARWATNSQYLKSVGIRDVKDITNDVLVEYAKSLRTKLDAGDLSLTYATSLMSSLNRVVAIMRGDQAVKIAPSKYLGSRCRARKLPPKGMDAEKVKEAAKAMATLGNVREALVILIARLFGCRKKEACLLDTKKALAEALRENIIRITRGTKGGYGHVVPREIVITPSDLDTLRQAAALQGDGTCLIPSDMSLEEFVGSVNRAWRKVRNDFELGKIHDLRACKACEIYEQVSGYPAPVLVGNVVLADKKSHKEAQSKACNALGHKSPREFDAYGGRG